MEKHDFDMEKIVDQLNIDDEPRGNHKDRLRWDVLKVFNSSSVPARDVKYKWSFIMNSKITKFAAAAVILIAVGISFTLMEKTTTPAYAIEQTVEAYNSIRWLHISQSQSLFGGTRTREIWLGCDERGNVTKMRLEANNVGQPIGSLIIAGSADSYQAWLPQHNLRLIGFGNPSALIGYDVSELDPKLLIEKLLAQQERNEVIVDINEPLEKAEPIIVTVTYPEGSLSENWKKVYYIDQATKLVIKIDKFELKDQKFHHDKTLKLSGYNQPIDEMIFTLDGDVSDDARVIDLKDLELGLPQNDMTDEQIAVEVTTQFFEAVIDKDFYRAGQLYLGGPDFLVEQAFMGANVLKIISVGPAIPDPDPDSDAMICSCRALAELGGQYYEIDAWMVRVIGGGEDMEPWLICGTAISASPASGTITLSTDDADLSEVTYDGLEAGELMQKWLLLEPIPIEVRGDTLFPSEETQEDEFKADYIDVANFEPEVIIGEKDYPWSLLENDYGTIDLTSKYEDWSLITYAWAQIDMPEEKHGILGIGSDDSVKVWLNGELVHENWTSRGVGIDNDHVPVTFKKGINQLVIKVQNGGGSWGFCCRLLDE
jgi:hypothetical protein